MLEWLQEGRWGEYCGWGLIGGWLFGYLLGYF